MRSLTTEQVWTAIDGAFFGVLAFVNRDKEPRSTGVCYASAHGALYISTDRDMWKVRHIQRNPAVAMTVAIPKRVPFLPFIKVPPATITFHGTAEILEVGDIAPDIFKRLPLGNETDRTILADAAIIRVVPQGEFVTYGIDMPITQMANHQKAHGRAPCGTDLVVS